MLRRHEASCPYQETEAALREREDLLASLHVDESKFLRDGGLTYFNFSQLLGLNDQIKLLLG